MEQAIGAGPDAALLNGTGRGAGAPRGVRGAVVAEGLVERARVLRASLAAFDPGALSGEDCAAVAEQLALTEKACAAAKARAAARAAACGMHRERGFGDAAEWLAQAAGSSAAAARSALETASALERRPATREAVACGELSLEQARLIAETEAAVPGSEPELVALARRSSLAALGDEARTAGGWRRSRARSCTAASAGPGPCATGATPRAWSACGSTCPPTGASGS
jgi:hypothetical protein